MESIKATKYIFITGGVVSGLGKGIAAASLGRLLKQRGLKVSAMKLDPYMNMDPSNMSPFQHGEVFVTDDGAETDLDLGHYERFIDENLSKHSSLTSGKVYFNVLEKERAGKYLGGTVQTIPHVTKEIKNFIYAGVKNSEPDVIIIEIGGTIGDIESLPFSEAIRQVSIEQGRENCLFVHVTLVPYLKSSKEHKSKPAQRSVRELMALGITPNIIIARADEPMDPSIKEKISLFCNVREDCVIEAITADSLYEVPLELHQQGFDEVVCRELSLKLPAPDLKEWQDMADKIRARKKTIKIAIVGKYVQYPDAYLSLIESLNHAGFHSDAKVDIAWIDSEDLNINNAADILKGIDAIIVPGGFGSRGIEGKVAACQYARENNTPFLGICLGMHMAVVEFARNVCGLAKANSTEFDEATEHPVIHIMPDQVGLIGTGGTMRVGAYPCKASEGSLLAKLYDSTDISERHRHRFELNNDFREALTSKGLVISGILLDGNLAEAIELPTHPFYIAVQFHPEFKSRPNRPHPLFMGLLKASEKKA